MNKLRRVAQKLTIRFQRFMNPKFMSFENSLKTVPDYKVDMVCVCVWGGGGVRNSH